jgi:hypothetical protein
MPRRTGSVAFSLGWELEATRRAENISDDIVAGYDASVAGEGTEYKIRETVVNSPDRVMEALKKLTAERRLRVDRSCGFHVHVGIQNATVAQKKVWASWMVVLAKELENDVFLAVPESRRTNRYCMRWGQAPQTSVITRRYHASKYSNNDRYYWVNVVEMFRQGGIKTTEVRLLGNTRRFTYLLGWTSAVLLMGKAAWNLTNDPMVLPGKLAELRSHFKLIQTDIMPNESFEKCAMAANDLANKAGLFVRASTSPSDNASTRNNRPAPTTEPAPTEPAAAPVQAQSMAGRMQRLNDAAWRTAVNREFSLHLSDDEITRLAQVARIQGSDIVWNLVSDRRTGNSMTRRDVLVAIGRELSGTDTLNEFADVARRAFTVTLTTDEIRALIRETRISDGRSGFVRRTESGISSTLLNRQEVFQIIGRQQNQTENEGVLSCVE